MLENDSIRKANFKTYEATNWKTNDYISYLTNKDDQTMKFGQLIEYSMKKIFFEKSYTKCGGETNTTFLKHQNF